MNEIFLGLIGSANLASLGLIVKIYFMVGGLNSSVADHKRRINNLEKKHV